MNDILEFKGVVKHGDTIYYKNKNSYKLYSSDETIFDYNKNADGDPHKAIISATYSNDKLKIIFKVNPRMKAIFSKTYQMTVGNVIDITNTLDHHLSIHGYNYADGNSMVNKNIQITKYGDRFTLVLDSQNLKNGYKGRCTNIDLIFKLFEKTIRDCMNSGMEVMELTEEEMNTLLMENKLLSL